jgi:hypothetical protein
MSLLDVDSGLGDEPVCESEQGQVLCNRDKL